MQWFYSCNMRSPRANPGLIGGMSVKRYYEQSKKAVPVELGLIIAASLAFYALSFFIHVPLPIIVIVIGLSLFTLLCDVINIIHYKMKQSKS